MLSRLLLLGAAAAAVLGGGMSPALAKKAGDSNAAQDASGGGSDQKSKKICRREQPIGSIMIKTTCHTREEWSEIDAANEAAASHTLGRDTAGGGGALTPR